MKTIKHFLQQFPFISGLKFALLDIIRRRLNPNAYLAYSQTGEDIIIRTILGERRNGFYIEVGSNEPIQHSNTFGLYQNGWKGITIDANCNMVELHKKLRPNDVSICAAVSDEVKEVTFYEFDMDEISTIDDAFYTGNKVQHSIKSETKIKTQTLDSLLKKSNIVIDKIDLLSIDVEGHDYQVLRSLDLNIYRPKLILIEMHGFDMFNPNENNIYKHLIENDYKLVGYAVWNGYFLDNRIDSNVTR